MLFEEFAALWRARALLRVLTQREVLARYTGAAGGLGWAYAQPVLTLAAYYLVFDVVFKMRLGELAPTRSVGIFLVVGVLPWMAFADALQRGMGSLLEVGSLLQKNPLPPILFPARSLLASMVVFAPLLVVMALIYGVGRGVSWCFVALIPMLILQSALGMVLGYLLAILAAALRDVVQIVSFVLSVGTFCSPILFPVAMFPAAWQWVLWLNPMTPFVLAYQAVLLEGAWPSLAAGIAMVVWLVVGSGLLALALRRSRDQLVDWL